MLGFRETPERKTVTLFKRSLYTNEINRICRKQNIKKLTPAEQQIKDIAPQWISAVSMIEIQIQTVH